MDQDYQHENIRQLVFLVECLLQLEQGYQHLNIPFHVFSGDTYQIVSDFIANNNIGILIVSASYTTYFSAIQKRLADVLEIPVILVDDNSYLPAWYVSDKEEYAAYTLRKKYWNKAQLWWDNAYKLYEIDSDPEQETHSELQKIIQTSWYKKALKSLNQDSCMVWWEQEAQKKWDHFIQEGLSKYAQERNNPNRSGTSFLSPYLHFWCISPIQIFHELEQIVPEMRDDPYVEELFVRRELAINMWYYNEHHASWKCLPEWVIKTLDEQQDWRQSWKDHRWNSLQTILEGMDSAQEYRYTYEQLAVADTHDPLWNAAQHQLRKTGKIHGYVRMYWWKQIITWINEWRDAYDIAVRLNDTFAVDGASPNGYTGIAWCFGKHDRPFPPKKPYYGIVRSMKMSGMKKRFDVEKYVTEWSR